MRNVISYLVLSLMMISISSAVILNSGSEVEFYGTMEYDSSQEGIFLMTADGIERVNLDFAFDEESDLVIDDFGYVNVRGRYLSLMNVLKVEEIDQSTELPVLCYVGK